MMRVSPLQNLFGGQAWKPRLVSDATFFCQQLCQRRAAGQTTISIGERGVEISPFLAKCAHDIARGLVWPLAGISVVRICPLKNLFYCHVWHRQPVLNTSHLRE